MICRPPRLSIFMPSLRDGGAERSMLSLAEGIAGRGYAVDLVLAQTEGPYMAEIPASLRVVDLRASRVLSSLGKLARYLRRERPEAMLSVMNHANIVALWARRLGGVSTRIVVSERNNLSAGIRHKSSWQRSLLRRLITRYYPWADGIVAVSEGVGDDLAQAANIPRERIEVIYNPIMRPTLRKKMHAAIDHPWFGSDGPPVLLAAGRFCRQKDFPTLIRAFAQVRRTRSARLVILGRGVELPAMKILIGQLGLQQEVSLPGFVSNPYPYMARAAMFVLSSKFEGLPGVLIEAICCGARVVSTDCPSGPREILRDGKYGSLVPVGNVNALAEAIEATLEGNTPAPTAASWQPFELETVVDQYLSALLKPRGR